MDAPEPLPFAPVLVVTIIAAVSCFIIIALTRRAGKLQRYRTEVRIDLQWMGLVRSEDTAPLRVTARPVFKTYPLIAASAGCLLSLAVSDLYHPIGLLGALMFGALLLGLLRYDGALVQAEPNGITSLQVRKFTPWSKIKSLEIMLVPGAGGTTLRFPHLVDVAGKSIYLGDMYTASQQDRDRLIDYIKAVYGVADEKR